ncbi:MAG: arginine repressor [Ruminococcaceae bacterium]|nr:arginine repressor [Oscillospiraceae bacterium]
MNKAERQLIILNIISKYDVSTQDELTELLNQAGCNVTQATTSRDLQEMRITKAVGENGKYKYLPPNPVKKDTSDKMNTVFTQCVTSCDYANNIVVVKTISGAAQACAAALDSFDHDAMLGCIAGDDTIMAVVRSVDAARELVDKLSRFIER